MPNLFGRLAAANLSLLGWSLERVSPGHRSWLARQLMQDRYHPRSRMLASFFTGATLAWKNKQYDVDLNGESALLRRLAPFSPKVVFDVGANVGEWSLAACAALPKATIYAFEIAPPTAVALARNLAPHAARAVVNREGLADRPGELTIYLSPESSTATSTSRSAFDVGVADHNIVTVEEMVASVTTGDAYMAARGIDRIDLLKVDVEGSEPAVFAGFAEAFRRGAITLVQFEYGPLNLATRHMLADFASFFAGHGFELGKLLPEGVAFKPFEVTDEDFVGPNFIACHASRPDIIAALRCPPLLPG